MWLLLLSLYIQILVFIYLKSFFCVYLFLYSKSFQSNEFWFLIVKVFKEKLTNEADTSESGKNLEKLLKSNNLKIKNFKTKYILCFNYKS